jgi:hypothetical protein
MEATPELGREQGGQGSGRAAKIGPTASATQDVNKQTQQVDSTSRLNKQTQQADSTSRLTRVAWPLSPLAHLFVCSRSRNVQRSVSGLKSQGCTTPCRTARALLALGPGMAQASCGPMPSASSRRAEEFRSALPPCTGMVGVEASSRPAHWLPSHHHTQPPNDSAVHRYSSVAVDVHAPVAEST